ncbi:hypothetical protein H257_03712 [Aphanomyces astaci]|uniref:Fibronectin type-III domain-containing protein n=1 Tax=Aphanomyces astaci TaxID=112090 RepID=W4H050_APHAT|nr:hypothetical protein H257_03712 [Aphanomyces astaci]ETV84538.1 hypothetical protein H257_03712 [Aphanomyces astaci]|eukprot:XP_009826230.1 hypothetical protein H257_03712 [Aphanomyces astaci]
MRRIPFLVFSLCGMHVARAQSLGDVPFRTVEALWSFHDGLDDWAQSSTDTMRAEINPRDGYIHGTVLADAPFVDSPLLDLEIEDRHHFVVRMAYDGACAQAGLHLERRGAPVTPKTNPKAPFVNPIVVRFPITSDGSQHVYYAPLFPYVQGDISRIRFFPCLSGNDGRHQGNTFHIDWIMVAKAPTVTKVRGCIDRYSQVPLLQPLLAPSANISMITTLTNGIHPVFSTLFHAMILPFASTYNCYPGDEITVQGRNFGDAALVHINGAPCQNNYPTLESIPELASDAPDEEVLTCVLPANLPRGPAVVTVTNERYRGLVFNGTMVAYAVPVQLTTAPSLSNVMAHAVDITWTPPPNDVWTCLTITGYLVIVRRLRDNVTVTTMLGNVTTTTLATLSAGAPYSVTVSAVVESQNTTDWQQVDMYGQRLALPSAIVGLPSPALVFSTLALDFEFTTFSAQATLNHSISVPTAATLGPTGDVGGQGLLGLTLVGHAHVEHCNATSACCDFDSTGQTCAFTCRGSTPSHISSAPQSTSNSGSTTATTAGVSLLTLVTNVTSTPTSSPPLRPCGPALRLTWSAPFLTGAAWYPRRQNVREGFATSFQFRLSNPSLQCKVMDDVSTHCRARGGDGFAFVIQNEGGASIGRGGHEVGYGGIRNAVSVEFDTTYNADTADMYENHVSIHTRGRSQPNSAHHAYSLGATSEVPDLTDRVHTVHIRYVPVLDDDMPFAPHFQASAYVSQFFAKTTGASAWGSAGVGCLQVTVDDRTVLSVPLHLDNTLDLTGGRAFVGFTAATGAVAWQAHDILSWQWESLRMFPLPPAPFTHV